jgi:hypothetical protein
MYSSLDAKKDEMIKNPSIHGENVKDEHELRPEYIEKIKKIEKANKKPISIKNIDDLFVDE